MAEFHYAGFTSLDFGPIGKSLVYASYKGGRATLWLRPLQGGAPRPLVDLGLERHFAFKLSLDGRQIAWISSRMSTELVLFDGFD